MTNRYRIAIQKSNNNPQKPDEFANIVIYRTDDITAKELKQLIITKVIDGD